MPRVAYDEENKTYSALDMDRFKLEKGEVARVALFDKEPEMDFTHFIKDFSYVVCLGDYKKLVTELSDPEKCPACAAASSERDAPVSVARRNFVTHLLRYTTDKQGAIIQPMSVRLQLWKFNDDKFNKLTDRAKEHGDLLRKDLIIKCTAQQYQTYDIDVSGQQALWQTNAILTTIVKDMVQGGKKAPDMDKLLGRRVSYDAMMAAVSKIQPGIVGGEGVAAEFADVFKNPDGEGTAPADLDMDSFFSSDDAEPASEQIAEAAVAVETATVSESTTEEPTSSPPQEAPNVATFEALLES